MGWTTHLWQVEKLLKNTKRETNECKIIIMDPLGRSMWFRSRVETNNLGFIWWQSKGWAGGGWRKRFRTDGLRGKNLVSFISLLLHSRRFCKVTTSRRFVSNTLGARWHTNHFHPLSLTHARLHKHTDKKKREIYRTIKHKWSKENMKNTLSMNTRIKNKNKNNTRQEILMVPLTFPSLSVSSLGSLVHLYTIFFSSLEWRRRVFPWWLFLSWAVGERDFGVDSTASIKTARGGRRERDRTRDKWREREKCAQSGTNKGQVREIRPLSQPFTHTLSIRSIHCDCLYRSEIKDKN